MADCSGTGTGIDLEDLRVPVKRALLVMRSQCAFHDGRGSQVQLSFAVGDLFSTFDELETMVKAYERAHH